MLEPIRKYLSDITELNKISFEFEFHINFLRPKRCDKMKIARGQ